MAVLTLSSPPQQFTVADKNGAVVEVFAGATSASRKIFSKKLYGSPSSPYKVILDLVPILSSAYDLSTHPSYLNYSVTYNGTQVLDGQFYYKL